jgi:hypothetical protein
MDYLSMFFLWLGFATFIAGVTYTISMFAGQKYSEKTSTIHWVHWCLLPLVYLFWALSSLFILFFRKDKKAKISYNAYLILKRMFADWSV